MFKQVLVVLLLCLQPHGDGSSLIVQDIGNNRVLEEYTHVALDMVRRFITQRTNTLVIMEKCNFLCEEHKKYHLALLQNLLNNLNYTLTVQLLFGKSDDRPWDYNIFVVDSWWAFEALRFRFPESKHERQFYFFILLTVTFLNSDTLNSHMIQIFKICLYLSVKNVVIMHKSPNEPHISFYTYQIFEPLHCHQGITLHEFNRYENGHLRENFLFPDHMNNFHGCSIRVCGNLMQPLLTFKGDPNNATHLKDMERLGGVEGEILNLVANTMNMKLQFRFPRQMNIIGRYNNSTGCFADLEQNRAQIVLGGLSPLLPNSEKFTYSYAYHTTPNVFVVRSGLLFGPIKQLLNPLHNSTWCVVLIHLLISIAIVDIIERVRKPELRNFMFGPANKYPKRNLFVILLGNPLPSHSLPRRNFARFLLMAWMLYTFELRNGYQGKMFDSLRLAKRAPMPQTISELLDLDYTLLMPRYIDFYPMNKTQIMRNTASRLDLLNKSDLRLTTTALLDFLFHYNVQHWNSSSLVHLEENVYVYQCVMFFNKHSILAPSFERKLKLLSDAGITAYIANRYVRWRHKRNINGPSPSPTRITNHSLRGLYAIYGILCEVAIFFFIMELLARKSRRLKRFMDWLN